MMKTAKLTIGIISIVLCAFVLFQSCAVGLFNVLDDSDDTSGSAGLLVAILMLVAGIVGITTRNSKKGGITSGVLYALAGVIGISNTGIFVDLKIWAVICIAFAVVFIVGSVGMNKTTLNKTDNTPVNVNPPDNTDETDSNT